MNLTRLLVLALLVPFCPDAAFAQETAPVAPAKTTRVALFKNGLGFFDASATLPEHATTVRLSQLPVPTLGTFWLGYGDDVKLRGAVASMDDGETVPAATLLELLRINTGKVVRLYLREVAEQPLEVVEGTLLLNQPAESLLLRTEASIMAVAPDTVVRAEFLDVQELTSATAREKVPVLRLKLDEPAPGKQVGISYLARGITWTPAYRIDLSDPATAGFSAHAIVINEAVDLEDTHVDLITGYPHIPLAANTSPLAMTQSLSQFLTGLSSGTVLTGGSGGFGGGGFGGGGGLGVPLFANNAAVFENGILPQAPPAPEYPEVIPGQAAEDLFLYPVEHVTLKRGETAYLPLFSKEMPYKHVYTWRVGEMPESAQQQTGNVELSEVVWHVCRLTNAGDMPLTTAPAEFVANGAFIGQDTCHYTVAGAETSVRINRAMNLTAVSSETETARLRNHQTVQKTSYDLVTLRGTLTVQSRSGEAVTMEITKHLSGKLLSMTPECKSVTGADGPRHMNPEQTLVWSIDLPAGGKTEIEYTYEVYVSS